MITKGDGMDDITFFGQSTKGKVDEFSPFIREKLLGGLPAIKDALYNEISVYFSARNPFTAVQQRSVPLNQPGKIVNVSVG